MNGKKIGIILIITILLSSIVVNAASVNIKNEYKNPNTKSYADAEWTIMVYLDGDNDLESYAIDDFLEMANVGSTNDVNIIVQFDRTPYYYSGYGDWASTKRYRVTNGMIPDADSAIQDIGEANMGDPQTVIDFANWAKNNWPADKYCFIFWDHGSGWKPKGNDGRKYVCLDETSGDALELYEIGNALSSISNYGTNKIDLVGFDACLMGMIEVGYEIYQYAGYMTASEETEPVSGWDYQGTLNSLVGSPTMSAEELGAQFVNYYYGYKITLSTVNLGNFIYLTYVLDDLAESMKYPQYKDEIREVLQQLQTYDDYDYGDLYHFAELVTYEFEDVDIKNKAQTVMYEVNNAVTSEKHDSYNPNSHGIAIYAPYYSYNTNYESILFSQYTKWDDFLYWYHGGNPNSNPPSSPTISGPKNGTAGVEYAYSFESYDIDGDDIHYYVEWGDYSEGEWSDALPSGTPWETYHTWWSSGAYVIKAKAMDINGAESGWSYYTITMPRFKSYRLLEKFIDLFPFIKQIITLKIVNKLLI